MFAVASPSPRWRLAALVVALGLVFAPAAGAATRGDGWAPAGAKARQGGTPALALKRFAGFTLDRPTLAGRLAGAPRAGKGIVVSLPGPDGKLHDFTLRRSQVLAPAVAAAHPEITTYEGTSVDQPATTVAADLGPMGFHASVRGGPATWYVDPYLRHSERVYASYYGRNAERTPGTFVEREAPLGRPAPSLLRSIPTGPTLRTYRLALASDPSYAAAVGGPGNVTAAKTTLMARVDQVYEQDLSIQMTVIPLNFNTNGQMTSAGYSTPTPVCDDQTLNDNQKVLDKASIPGGYDIGHIVLGADGGGLAGLGVIGENNKAWGCTGIPQPVGDQFAIDYVAHEMGHEFGAEHTFNGETDNCGGGNRAGSSAVEPGSGSSIMAYAGICGADDLQAHSDPYFSERSLDEINSFVNSSPAHGGTTSQPGDNPPDVHAPAALTIPVRTPFTLTGSATDLDAGQTLTYLWEQNDPGGDTVTLLHQQPKTSGPLFRQFGTASVMQDPAQYDSPGENAAGTSASRTFPDVAQILAGDTNAATGTCAANDVNCFSEFLPTADYAGPMHFRLTVRDGHGGVSSAETTVAVATGAGPFRVTRPAGGTALGRGEPETVTWDVAGTNLPPLSVGAVQISASTDGGKTYSVLAASTPNDGAEAVTMPDVGNSQLRIRVQALGNPFLDVSHGNATLEYAPQVSSTAPAGGLQVQYTDAIAPVTVSASDRDGPGSALTAVASGLPAGLGLTTGPAAGASRSFTLAGATTGSPGTYPGAVTVRDAPGAARSAAVPVVVAPEDATARYTGDGAAEGRKGTATLAARIAEIPDGTPGDLATAIVAFREGARTVCGPVPVTAAGTASCAARLGDRAHTVSVAVGGNYTAATTTRKLAAPSPALCSGVITLTDVSRQGRRVRLAGFAQRRLAGRRVTLTANGRTVGHAKVAKTGRFAARVGAPRGGRTAYRAKVAGARSAALRLARPLTARASGTRIRGTLRGAGSADRRLTVFRSTNCTGKPKPVKRLRTDAQGRFSLRVARPKRGSTVVYRVRTASGRPRASSLPLVVLG
jgi:Metallo-peptidase family M12